MKKFLKIYFIVILFIDVLNAGKMWVFFSDKKTNTDNYVSLSEKSILRRQKVNKGVTWYDRQISDDYIQAISETGATIHRQSKWLNALSVSGTEEQINTIRELPFVKKIQPVAGYKRKKEKLFTPSYAPRSFLTDSSFYGFAWEQIKQINSQEAHTAGYYGQGVRILLLDTGFNTELAVFDSLNIIDEWDFINNDGITANETDSENTSGQHNHGTMVFSTMAGFDPGNFIGPAFRSEFLLAKTEDVTQEIPLEEDNYVAALEWGEQNGADVASSSLGYLDWYSYCDMDGNTAVTTNAVNIAVSLGVVCVTSAGNWGTNEPPANPCDTLYYYISAPADADSVIAVGAVNSEGDIAYFSSHGPTYDGRIKPEVCARGVSTWCVNPNSSDFYRTASGTSFSAPLVGGAAAIVLSAHPEWTPMEVREAFMMTADRSVTPDNDYGYGIIDVMAAIDYGTSNIDEDNIPDTYSIQNIYPNPFNSSTTIRFSAETLHAMSLHIYDISGRLVVTLVNGKLPASRGGARGEHEITWNADGIPSGIYFVQLITADTKLTKKITLLK